MGGQGTGKHSPRGAGPQAVVGDRLAAASLAEDFGGLHGAGQRRAEDHVRPEIEAAPERGGRAQLLRALRCEPPRVVVGRLRRASIAVAQEVEDHATVVALLPSFGVGSSAEPPRDPAWPAIMPRVCPVRSTMTRPAFMASALGKVIDSTPLP